MPKIKRLECAVESLGVPGFSATFDIWLIENNETHIPEKGEKNVILIKA